MIRLLTILLICASIANSAHASENKPHALILTGSPLTPFGKLEYRYQFGSAFAMKTGFVIGTAGFRVDRGIYPFPYGGTYYYNETLLATPLIFCFPIYKGENPISLSFGGLIVFQPDQFFVSDYGGPGFDLAFSAGGDWQYSIPATNWFVSVEGAAYIHLGEYPSKRIVSPWIGAGIGWKF
ncbi:MAG: hypothetical protein IPM69_10410 [Ignavibacteria bacterium]|nr:hypothetical protein [Ignavibacteria bacterium]